MDTRPEALVFADDRPTSVGDDLYQWAVDAEDLIRRQQAERDALRAEVERLQDEAARRIAELETLHGLLDQTDPARQPLMRWSSQALLDVAAERRRQIEVEGWTPEHDDAHGDGSMAVAASCYADTERPDGMCPGRWPWRAAWWKPRDRRSDLVRAGALILAEIERLDRAA